MSTNAMNTGDDQLRSLVRAARPTADLPPGFENRVWQRIESLERQPATLLDRLAAWLLRPRIAAGALAAVVILATGLGAVQGTHTGEETARHRYLASVDPAYRQH